MSGHAPRVTIAKPARSNGVLSVPAPSTTKAHRSGGESNSSRSPAARLKLVIRRLPPGLTQTEFEEALGDDWTPDSSKVDWTIYKPGKVSKECAGRNPLMGM